MQAPQTVGARSINLSSIRNRCAQGARFPVSWVCAAHKLSETFENEPQGFVCKLEGINMEFLSAPWWSALLAIVLIDLVLAGDNAIVIALAARNLPPALQKKAIVWGTVGAIAVRSLIPHRVHASIGVLGAVSVATACLIPDSPAAKVAKVPQGRQLTLGVEHPTGVTECVVTLDEAGQPVEAGMLRTARKLMDGEIFA